MDKNYLDWVASEKEEEKLAFSRYKSKTEDFGTRYSVLGTRFFGLGTKDSKFDNVYPVLGTRFLGLGTKDSEFDNVYPVPERSRRVMISTAAAAVIILLLSTTILIKKDDIFKPKYPQEQVELAYEHTIKILSTYSKSLSKSTSNLKSIDLDIKQKEI